MNYVLSLFLVLIALVSCDRNTAHPSITSCSYPGIKLTRTNQFINDVPATIIAVSSPGTQVVRYQIMRGGTSAALGTCNLPVALAKDSLKITVSGYFLTFPGLDVMNLTPLPFEVTEATLRK